MAYPVYSTRFLAQASFVGSALYTVPSGYRAVVRFVSVTVDVGPCEAYLVCPTGVSLLFIQGEPAGYGAFYDVRVVYNQGETIAYAVSSGKADIYVGGFLLQLP